MALQSKEEQMKEKMNETLAIDVNVEISIPRSPIVFDETKHKIKCSCCGKGFTTRNGNFNKSNDVLFQSNDGYLPFCKECAEKYVTQTTALFSNNEELAIKDFCQRAGWNYDLNPLIASRETYSGHRDRHRLFHYAAKKNLNCNGRKTFIDSLKFEFLNKKTEVIETLDDVKDSKKVKLKAVKFFGTGFEDDDYSYLEDEYLDWTTRHECSTKAQEEVFKQICYAQLDILKAKKKNLPTKDLTKTLQDLLSTANLQPRQTKDNTLADQNTFGTLIRKWENEKPIPEPDEEWKDVDRIAKYITIYFLGHLCKMMGIKNSYARMYEQEMDKYKVDKPEYEDDDEALFDAVFGGGLDDSE